MTAAEVPSKRKSKSPENPKVDNPHLRTFSQRVGYRVFRRVLQLTFLIFCRIRVLDVNNLPAKGGALVCSNHQSHLDPMLVGHGSKRRFNYLARKTLFKFKPFAWAIDFLDAIPLDQNGMGIAGIKETMKRLKRNELVLIFPEGTRTRDGELGEISDGFIVMARRTKTPLVPVGIDGAFQAWPRSRKFPLPHRIAVAFGEPIHFEDYCELDDGQVRELLAERMAHEFQRARRQIQPKS